MARSFSSLVRLASIAAALTQSAHATADERVLVSPPASLIAGDPSWLASSPGARGDGLLRAALVVDYLRAPLVLVSAAQNAHAVVEAQLWLHATLSYSLRQRWLLALNLPLLLSQRGERTAFAAGVLPANEAAALGDPRLTLRGRVLGDADGFGLGVGLSATAPLSTQAYAGAPGPSARPFVSAGHQAAASFSAFDLGFAWQKSQTLPGVLPTRIGSQLQLALAGGVVLDRAQTTRVGPELALSMTTGNGATLMDPRSTSLALLVHVQHRLLGGPFELGFALGPSAGRAPGAPDYRALLSLAFSPEEPVPPPDADGDDVPDESDMCPTLAGEPSNDPMMHGCPALPSDADGDGIPDTLDACPQTAGEPSLVRKQHGCPKPQDRDRDGVPDPLDACPEIPGVSSAEPSQHGCPRPAPAVTLEAARITISEQVQFETGTALLRAESSSLLAQVAEILKQHAELESLEVAGHTDATGTPELNLQLSEARARAVLEWLVAHGVARQRLSARGYGQSRPLADNGTEQGRARNRRVEFLVTRRSAPPAGEP